MRKLLLKMGVSVEGFEARAYPTRAAIHVYRPRSST